jgi:hypothetical protein
LPGVFERVWRLSPAARYGIAIAAAALATSLRLALDPVWGLKFPLIFFYPAVAVSAWFGGFWPGIVTTLISAVAADHFWMTSNWSTALATPSDAVALLVFVGIDAAISGQMRRRRATPALARLEDRLRTWRPSAPRPPTAQARGGAFRLTVKRALGGHDHGGPSRTVVLVNGPDGAAASDTRAKTRRAVDRSPGARALRRPSRGAPGRLFATLPATDGRRRISMLLRDGPRSPSRSASSLETADGRFVLAAVTDISQRKKRNGRYRADRRR